MKHMIDHEYYKQPFDLTAKFLFILFILVIVYAAYNEISKKTIKIDVLNIKNCLELDAGPEYYKKAMSNGK